jgi:hypothetical protein
MRRPNINSRVRSASPVSRQNAINKLVTGSRTNQGATSSTGAPTFPGAGSGLTRNQVRDLIEQQPRCSGVSFSASSGSFDVTNLNLPGDAKLFLGLIFTEPPLASDTFTLSINNNKIIINGSVMLHSMVNSQSIKSQYFEYLQPLSGKDIIELTLETGGMNGVVQLHYI